MVYNHGSKVRTFEDTYTSEAALGFLLQDTVPHGSAQDCIYACDIHKLGLTRLAYLGSLGVFGTL